LIPYLEAGLRVFAEEPNICERPVPYIEEIDAEGFRAAFHDLERAALESRKEACELTIAEYLEVMSKKKP